MGNVHAKQYSIRSDVEMCFFDRRDHRAELFESRWGFPKCASVQDLLTKVDIVDICVPTPSHFEVGLAAIAAGRAVLMEKPLARRLSEAVKLFEAAAKANVPLMPGHVVRFFPEYERARNLVVDGGIGKPAAARSRRGGGAPSGSGGWFLDHSKSGGVLVDLSIHDFDWLRWMLGEVSFLYARSVGAKEGEGVDYALTTLTFDNGCVAHVEGTWMDPGGFRTHFEVAGDKGLIQHDSRNSAALRTTTARKAAEGAPLPNTEGSLTDRQDPYYREIDGFLGAVREKTEPPISALDGLMALSIAEAAVESAVTDKVVKPARQF
jgi:predicted dehydrogenase